MNNIGAYQAKTHFSTLLEQVENGEQFIITKHGQPVAKLVPFTRTDKLQIKETIKKLKMFNKINTLKMDWKLLRDEGRK